MNEHRNKLNWQMTKNEWTNKERIHWLSWQANTGWGDLLIN